MQISRPSSGCFLCHLSSSVNVCGLETPAAHPVAPGTPRGLHTGTPGGLPALSRSNSTCNNRPQLRMVDSGARLGWPQPSSPTFVPFRPFPLRFRDLHSEDDHLMGAAKLHELVGSQRLALHSAHQPCFLPGFTSSGLTEVAAGLPIAFRHQPSLPTARRDQADSPILHSNHRCLPNLFGHSVVSWSHRCAGGHLAPSLTVRLNRLQNFIRAK